MDAPERGPGPAQRRVAILMGLGIALLIAVALVWWIATYPERDADPQRRDTPIDPPRSNMNVR